MSGEIFSCRSCGSKELIEILSLGDQYVTNFVFSEEDQKEISRVPLNLVLCDKCKLLQIKHNAPASSMWGEQYWYKSGISTTVKEDLKDIVENSLKIANPKGEDIIIDIGCNDGTLLNFYEERFNLVGFEPSNNVAKEASEKGLKIINNFFNAEDFKKQFGQKKAKLITAISMFYDLEDPNKFLQDIVSILDEEGLFVIQQNYLVTMLENNAFDNICHEHREYYSFLSLKKILEKHGLEIFDVSQNEINGGSIRTYIRFKGNQSLNVSENAKLRVENIEKKELEEGLDTIKPYKEFAERIKLEKENLINFIKEEKSKGKKFWAYGASTRGNVTLQYFDLGPGLLEGIADKNSDKYGKKTVGTLIPIYSPEEMEKANPDYLIIMIWYFSNEIIKQEESFSKKGGKFILPLPKFKKI